MFIFFLCPNHQNAKVPSIVHGEPSPGSPQVRSIPLVLILELHRAGCFCLRFPASVVSCAENLLAPDQ